MKFLPAGKNARFMHSSFRSTNGRRLPIYWGVECLTKDGDYLNWCDEERKWMNQKELWDYLKNRAAKETVVGDMAPVHSVKAFKRHVKNHSSYVPEGSVFQLISRFQGPFEVTQNALRNCKSKRKNGIL